MSSLAREDADDLREIDRWTDGVGWLAAPEEDAERASHAIRGADGGVWLFDPVDAPGVDDLVTDLGEVAGVAVLSNYHARDAGRIADRHDVPVYLPEWTNRVADRLPADVRVERFAAELGNSGFRVRGGTALPGWRESVAYRPADGTLYVPDLLGTASTYTVGDERLAVYVFRRPVPPRDLLAGLAPERVLVGHGTGVFADASDALARALDRSRPGFPRALRENGAIQLRLLAEGAVEL